MIPAAALAVTLAAASASHATQYFLQTASMNTTYQANIYGPGYPGPGPFTNERVYVAPITFKSFFGTGVGAPEDAFNLLAFCVDIFHNISLGTVNLKYDDTKSLVSNSDSPVALPITNLQRLHVGRLVNYGQLVFNSTDANKVAKLAGLQGAIWEVINPSYTIVANNAAVNGYIGNYSGVGYNAFIADHGTVRSGISFITETGKYGTDAARQSFAFAVPEPATWVMMIGGFGLVGAMLRRSRGQMIPARA